MLRHGWASGPWAAMGRELRAGDELQTQGQAEGPSYTVPWGHESEQVVGIL